MQLSDYFRPAAETLTHTQVCMYVSRRQLHTLASTHTHTHENKGDLYMCGYNCDFLHHQMFSQNAAMFGNACSDLMQFYCSQAWYLCVCVHTWAYVTGRPAETCVLRVAPGNAGESNLGSVKAGEMCLSAPREPVSWFLFDRLKLWHQLAPQPPPLTTPSSSSKATNTGCSHCCYLSPVSAFSTNIFPHLAQCYLCCMSNDTHVYGLGIFWLPLSPYGSVQKSY